VGSVFLPTTNIFETIYLNLYSKKGNSIAFFGYRLSEKRVQTLVWQNQAKAWIPTKIFI
jgi:hypothetical protein